eukprot:1361791-Rhodomonas_salina.1
MPGTDLSRALLPGSTPVIWASCLYGASSGHIDIYISAISCRACYAMSGTDLSYGATLFTHSLPTPCTDLHMEIRSSYMMSDTDLAHGHTL